MKRIFTLSALLFIIFFTGSPSLIFAQDTVPVNAVARDEYARVVFEWKKDVQYSIDESGQDSVVLKFNLPAKAGLNSADFSAFKNIPAPVISSEDPLTLTFSIPEGTKVRAFDARGKVYFDIYDKSVKKTPKETTPEAKAETPKPELEKAAQPKTQVKLAFEPEHTKPVKPVSKSLPAVPPVVVTEPEILDPAEVAANEKNLEADANANQHVVSVASTSSVDVAVFENYGQLVWAIDQYAPHLLPSINGPHKEIFGAFDPVTLANGLAFVARMPAGLMVKAQGGGLLWRLVFNKRLSPPKPVAFEREVAEHHDLRGGKIIWPVKDAGLILDFPDPVTGQTIKVITVKDSSQFAGEAKAFVDFDVLNSPIGLAILPKVDDLVVERTDRGIEISRPEGLALADEKMAAFSAMENHGELVDFKAAKPSSLVSGGTRLAKPGIFRFEDWKIGDLASLNQNKNIILANLHNKEKPQQVEDLMTLAKMHLAHGRGAESLGFLEYALREMPELEKNPEFLALRGVARAFDWKSQIAFEDLSHPDLKPYAEIAYWRAFVLADLGDWQQAAEILPQDYSYLFNYPEVIADRLALSLAEVNLRAGKMKIAEDLLALIQKNESHSDQSLKAAVKYLSGEVHRQKGEKAETEKEWTELTTDPDDYYRARAGLALTRLLRDQNKIDNKQSIDRLERLRYAWRGDELEAQINYWLGHAYFESKDYVKGLTIMRNAASIAVDTVLGKRIAEEMRATFSDIFLKARLKDVSPLDSVAMYEQFTELVPAGGEGDKLVQILAEQLVKADLLERASKLLQHQVDHRLQGEEKARIGLRLAAIYLMDKQPKRAIRALSTTVKAIDVMPAENPFKSQHQREISLLSAKAYAQAGKGDKALAILKEMPKDSDVSRLKADIAWQAGYWSDAAEALNDVTLNDNISMTRPPTDDQRDLIMNQAIALNLANDRVALANLREKYKPLMLQTNRANQFELITRPRRDTELADKDTLLSIMSEVDLFKNFLDTYKSEGLVKDDKPEPDVPAEAEQPPPKSG